ncbi:MAG: hypothetical protein V9E86_00260 [Nitrosomonas sp.]
MDEAADWLSNETDTKWNPKKIIDFSIQQYRDRNKEKKDNYFYSFKDGKRIRKAETLVFTKESLAITLLPPSKTYLMVKFSEPEAVGWYRCRGDVEDPMPASYTPIVGGLVRVFNSKIVFADLYPKHLEDIYLYGKTTISQPCIEFMPKLGWEYALFDPLKSLTPEEVTSLESYSRSCHEYLPHDAIAELGGSRHVTMDMVGITKESLKKLLLDYKKTSHSTEKEGVIPTEGYTTEELKVLELARHEFWENHDPARPPKKDVVVGWLMERGISERLANAMDTIVRSPAARIGGNKQSTLKSK